MGLNKIKSSLRHSFHGTSFSAHFFKFWTRPRHPAHRASPAHVGAVWCNLVQFCAVWCNLVQFGADRCAFFFEVSRPWSWIKSRRFWKFSLKFNPQFVHSIDMRTFSLSFMRLLLFQLLFHMFAFFIDFHFQIFLWRKTNKPTHWLWHFFCSSLLTIDKNIFFGRSFVPFFYKLLRH